MSSNMTMKVAGDKLVIEVDVSAKALKAAGPSKSGKTRVVAKTGGFMGVTDKVKVNLTVTTDKD